MAFAARPVDLDKPLLRQQMTHRALFATKSHQQVSANVGVPGNAAHDTVQHLMLKAVKLHAATGVVSKSDHAIDIRIVGEEFLVETLRDVLGHGSGAIDRGDHANVVSSPRLSIWSAVAHEGTVRDWGGGRRDFRCAGIVLHKVTVGQVVQVHPGSLGNCLFGATDDLAVLADMLFVGNVGDGNLVPDRNGLQQLDGLASTGHLVAFVQVPGGNADIVLRVQVDDVSMGGVGH